MFLPSFLCMSGSVILSLWRALFVKPSETSLENAMLKPFEKSAWSVYLIPLEILTESSLLFYRFEKHKRRILRNRPGVQLELRVGKPNGVRVISLWKKSFCVENRVKKAKKSMEIIEMHTLVKIATFWTLKNLSRPQRALWGTVESGSNNIKGTGPASVFEFLTEAFFLLFKNRCWEEFIWRPSFASCLWIWELRNIFTCDF